MRFATMPNAGTVARPAVLLRLLMAFALLFTGLLAQAQSNPVISGFSPTSGAAGTVITVTGSNLSGVRLAQLEGTSDTSVRNVTATSLQFTLPNTSLTGRIRLISSCCAALSAGVFTVTGDPIVRPSISGFSPTSGPVGTVITVTGSGLQQVNRAMLSGSADTVPYNVSSTSLQFTLPSGSASGRIRVLNSVYDAYSSASFSVTSGTVTSAPTPVISRFSPASGPAGTVVTVSGSGFTGATSASINGGTAVPVSNVSSSSLSFTVPAGATSGPVRISNGSKTGVSSASYTVTASTSAPTIFSFSPTSGPAGTVVTVTGSGLGGVTSASLNGGSAIAVSKVTSSSLVFTVPTTASSGLIRVSDGTSTASSGSSYTVTAPAATPTISGFTPTSGPVGTVITVTGTGFSGATTASINGGTEVPVSNVSSSSLSFSVPSGASSGLIRIDNGTNTATSGAGYTVTTVAAPLPTGAIGPVAASRLLTQGTFGGTLATIDSAAGQTYDQWFSAQRAAAPGLISPSVPNDETAWLPIWWNNVLNGQDQLRQRMAFALSEIFVISDRAEVLLNRDQALANYYDILTRNALGDFRTLLEQVTLSPAMGRYLTHFRNDKADPAIGRHADQNYAREVMQLFTIGLVELNADGTPKLDGKGQPIPTYGPRHVEGLADVLTGWSSAPTLYTGETAWLHDNNYVLPMVPYENHHDTDAKTIVGDVVVPAGGTARADLKIALDTLFNHPNVGPFIALRLIQRLVTSNPSPQYIERVALAFDDNGQGVRGDLLAVARAILTDPEAVAAGDNTAGKLREPLLRLTGVWRAFSASASSGRYLQYKFQLPLAEFGQSVLSAPSVFNFFAPDFQRVGNIAFAGLVSPEFQNTNENTLILTANLLQDAIYQYQDSAGRRFADADPQRTTGFGADDIFLRTAAWEGFASDPTTLIDKLNLVFMQGQMPAAMRTTLTNYVAAIPASVPASRVIEALDLMVNSPQYAVQR